LRCARRTLSSTEPQKKSKASGTEKKGTSWTAE